MSAGGRGSARGPSIQPIRLGSLEDGDPDDLVTGADLSDVLFTEADVPDLRLSGARLDGVRFDGLRAGAADLKGTRLSEVVLERAHLPVVHASRAQWRDVQVGGRVGVLESYDAEWRSVHLVGCKLDYVNLRSAELVDVLFTDCVVDELDLLEAVARRVRFTDTRVNHLSVHRAELHDVDLRGAELSVVDGLLDLGGATVTPQQLALLAPLLADQIGIRVED